MTLKDAIQQAVKFGMAEQAGKCVDILRFKYGMNYEQCLDFFHKVSGCSAEMFEDLMQAADYEEMGVL